MVHGRDEHELPAQEVVSQLFYGPFNGQGLLLYSGVVLLVGEEFPTNEVYRVFLSRVGVDYWRQREIRCYQDGL